MSGITLAPAHPPLQRRAGSCTIRRPSRYSIGNRKHTAAAVMMQVAFALGDNGKPLTWAARRSSDKALWAITDDEEIIRLVDETKTMYFINANAKPRSRMPSYYNPQVKIKIKDGHLIRRTRGNYGGNRSRYISLHLLLICKPCGSLRTAFRRHRQFLPRYLYGEVKVHMAESPTHYLCYATTLRQQLLFHTNIR